MNKNCFEPDQRPVVEFSKLDENNKAQFLQFLIKNNITFDHMSGKQNFTAKITLKTLKPNKNNLKPSQSKNSTKVIKKMTVKQKRANKENDPEYLKDKTIKSINKSLLKSSLKSKMNQISNIYIEENDPQSLKSFAKITLNNSSVSPLRNQKPNSARIQMKNNHNISCSSISSKNLKKSQKLDKNDVQPITPQKKNIKYSPLRQTQKSKDRSVSNILQSQSTKKIIKDKNIEQNSQSLKSVQNSKNIQSSPFIKQLKMAHSINLPKKDTSKQKIRDKSPQNTNFSNLSLNIKKSKEKIQPTLNNVQSIGSHLHKNYESQNRIQLVSKYKHYFKFLSNNQHPSSLNSIQQRPVCWPLVQVQKFLDQFYDDNFAKNTLQILNGSKKINDSLHKNSKNSSHIVECFQNFMNRKFNKVQKAIEYNLINLLYSVAFYLNQPKTLKEEKQSSFVGLKLFQNFLTQKSILEDYLFFLFARNILKQDFKKTFISAQSQCFINKKQIDKFLKHIVGQNNAQILQEYHHMIFQQIFDYQVQINNFLNILVADYVVKRRSAQENYHLNLKNEDNQQNHQKYFNQSRNQFIHTHSGILQQHDDNSLENTFNKILNLGFKNDQRGNNIFGDQGNAIPQDSMQELTFGEDTRQMLKQIQERNNILANFNSCEDLQFWKSPYINQKNSHLVKQKLKDEFNEMIAEKLCQKTKELVELLNTQSNYSNRIPKNQLHNYGQIQETGLQQDQINMIQEVLFSKAVCLFLTVIQMNKVKWLKQLQITNPSQEDIEMVEQIQLFFRKIKEFPTAKDIAQFCKLILTVEQITDELSKFFI